MVIYSFDSDIFLFCFVCDAIVQSEMYTRCVCVCMRTFMLLYPGCAPMIYGLAGQPITTTIERDRERMRGSEQDRLTKNAKSGFEYYIYFAISHFVTIGQTGFTCGQQQQQHLFMVEFWLS